MQRYESMANNFRFMVLHVGKQVAAAQQLFERPSERLVAKIDAADDYIDIQKTLIEKECFAIVRKADARDKGTVDLMRSVITITNNLERIADFCANISRRVHALPDPGVLRRYPHRPFFDVIELGLGHVVRAIFERDTALALRICETESALNRLYHDHHEQVMRELPTSGSPGVLIDVLFTYHYLERVGDSLLNIGEAIISAIIGERLKIRQYQAMEKTLAHLHAGAGVEDMSFRAIWGTRSGHRIGTLADRELGGERRVLFKEGHTEKLSEEKENIERWQQLMPGLTPSVLDFQKFDGDAALLLEYIEGVTLQDLALSSDRELADRALVRLEATLRHIWTQTRTPEPINARYVQQLRARLGDVYQVHPYLQRPPMSIGGLSRPALDEQLEAALFLDDALMSPCGIFIHGDLNIDNIIYNADEDRVYFIDVHRSQRNDYLQDVSVFLVSHFRLPVFGAAARARLRELMLGFLAFVRGFAAEIGDRTYEARLALGLVRSFITSTRFQLNRRFAKSMYQRGIYLLDRITAHAGRPWEEFALPPAVFME